MFAHPTDQLRHPGGTQIPRPKRPEDQRQRPAPTTGYSLESRKERFQMADKQMIEELEAEQSMFVQTARSMSSDGTTLRLTRSRHPRSTFPIGQYGLLGTCRPSTSWSPGAK